MNSIKSSEFQDTEWLLKRSSSPVIYSSFMFLVTPPISMGFLLMYTHVSEKWSHLYFPVIWWGSRFRITAHLFNATIPWFQRQAVRFWFATISKTFESMIGKGLWTLLWTRYHSEGLIKEDSYRLERLDAVGCETQSHYEPPPKKVMGKPCKFLS